MTRINKIKTLNENIYELLFLKIKINQFKDLVFYKNKLKINMIKFKDFQKDFRKQKE